MRESKEEHPCKLVDISAGGAAVMSPVAVPLGERVVAYFDHIGGIEGMVARSSMAALPSGSTPPGTSARSWRHS